MPGIGPLVMQVAVQVIEEAEHALADDVGAISHRLGGVIPAGGQAKTAFGGRAARLRRRQVTSSRPFHLTALDLTPARLPNASSLRQKTMASSAKSGKNRVAMNGRKMPILVLPS